MGNNNKKSKSKTQRYQEETTGKSSTKASQGKGSKSAEGPNISKGKVEL